MGCSPSTLPAPSANSAAAGGQPTSGQGSLPPLDASEKDGSRLFCIKLRRSRLRRCSCGGVTLQTPNDGNGSTAGSGAGDNLCGQVLLNPLQTKNEADYEKVTKHHSLPRGWRPGRDSCSLVLWGSSPFLNSPLIWLLVFAFAAQHREEGLDCHGGSFGKLYAQRGATCHRQ